MNKQILLQKTTIRKISNKKSFKTSSKTLFNSSNRTLSKTKCHLVLLSLLSLLILGACEIIAITGTGTETGTETYTEITGTFSYTLEGGALESADPSVSLLLEDNMLTITRASNTEFTLYAKWEGVTNSEQTIEYSLSPNNSAITMDQEGKITITSNAKDEVYTIEAKGIAEYTGTRRFTFTIKTQIILGVFTYGEANNIEGVERIEARSPAPQWEDSVPEEISYRLSGAPEHITIDENTGEITVTKTYTYDAASNQYQVIAEKNDGSGIATTMVTLAFIDWCDAVGTTDGISKPTTTSDNVYEIENWRELEWLSRKAIDAAGTPNLGNKYKLTGDLELPYKECRDEQKSISPYKPIGTKDKPFAGSFDGGSKTIRGLVIEAADANYVGMFGVIKSPEDSPSIVKDLVLMDIEVQANAMAGALMGELASGTVQNVHAKGTGSVITTENIDSGGLSVGAYTGGLIGKIGRNSVLEKLSSSLNVEARGDAGNYVGGLVGHASSNVTGYTTGTVTGRDYVGGLVGYTEYDLTNGYTTGAITGNDYVGGLAGKGAITNGYTTGTVAGNNKVGGLVGLAGSTTSGYATGDVAGNDSVGGLVGVLSYDVTGYAMGQITGATNVGGLVGDDSGNEATGYSRATVVSKQGSTATTFGKIVGKIDSATINAHYSGKDGESTLYQQKSDATLEPYDSAREHTAVGSAVTVESADRVDSLKTKFDKLNYSTSNYPYWETIEGHWPAINLEQYLKDLEGAKYSAEDQKDYTAP